LEQAVKFKYIIANSTIGGEGERGGDGGGEKE